MKLALFLCAFLFSLPGWCASVNPSQPATRAITRGHETVENVKPKEGTNSLLLLGLFIYLAILFWWAITAKNSLDKILKNVLQDIARY